MRKSEVRYSTFPRTELPPPFIGKLAEIFEKHENKIGTLTLGKGLTSNQVMGVLANALANVGFQVEKGKKAGNKIERPVFFGENGQPTVRYQIDAYHPAWKCGLEIEAGRAWMGNAVYRDLIQAAVMVDVDVLCLAVPNGYRYNTSGKSLVSRDYDHARQLADALYGHSRLHLPYRLVVIGY